MRWAWDSNTRTTALVAAPGARDLRGLRDFVREQKARLGLVITNDSMARLYEENIVGLPFNCL